MVIFHGQGLGPRAAKKAAQQSGVMVSRKFLAAKPRPGGPGAPDGKDHIFLGISTRRNSELSMFFFQGNGGFIWFYHHIDSLVESHRLKNRRMG